MWLVGGIYGYGYHVLVWLVGVVVRRYIDILSIIINFPYSTCISSFFGSSIPTSLFIFKCFFGLVSVIFLQYIANVTIEHSRSLKKSRSREYNCLILSVIKNVERASTARAHESRDFHVRGTE